MWTSRWSWSIWDISYDEFFGENFSKEIATPPVPQGSAGFQPTDPMKPEDFEDFIEKAVEEHESALIGYARTFLYDLDRARDVVQDTFIRLC